MRFPVKQKTFVFLETVRKDILNQSSYLFVSPIDIITSHNLDKIKDVFAKLESYLNQGYYAAGFFSYEMGYGFENLYQTKKKNYKFPLIWLGIFKERIVLPPPLMGEEIDGGEGLGNYRIKNLRLNVSKKEYLDSIGKIKKFIRAGETYQVNYTMKYKFDFSGSPYKFYQRLRNNQSVSYSAFIKADDFKILSFSPELFFRKKGDEILVKPMKGTMERGKNIKEDRIKRNKLKFDLKNNAENIMIVDLLRNDLGMVSATGTVKVPALFTVEKYETLFQMTSTVKSRLRKNLSLYELFSAIFPSGSVTGAPKIRTMQIIEELEKEERKVYTGAVGFFTPEKEAVFNVAIRTLLLEGKKAEMGIGSGIVQDSDAVSEYEECKLKGEFLVNHRPEFQLIETMLWSKKTGFFLLQEHLKRLKESAIYFNFHYDGKQIKNVLSETRKRLNPGFFYKIRMLFDKSGAVSLAHQKLASSINRTATLKLIALSKHRTSSKDIFLRHKTTHRKLYEQEYKKYKKLGFYDVLFRNEKGEITEGSISNILIKKGKFYWTPPLNCGLLNGVYRRYLLSKKPNFREKVLTLDDLKNADKIYLVNSVRRMQQVDIKNVS